MRLLLLLFICAVTGCSMCGNDPINAEVSPNGERVAIAFIRSCGATTPFYSQVSILDMPGPLPSQAGNIFSVEGKHPLTVEWVGDQELKIGGIAYGEQSLQLSDYRGTRIKYE